VVLGANRPLTQGLARVVAAPFILLRIPPNAITIFAFLISAIPAALAYYHDWLWAGLSLGLLSGFDSVDGAVARARNRVTAFGGYLDSVLDRASDAVVLFGVGFGLDSRPGWFLIAACVTTSFMISYARARAYQDATPPPQTWNQLFERPERIILLSLVLLAQGVVDRARPGTDVLVWGLLAFAVLGAATVLARILRVRAIHEPTRT
jgi:phosphatidylglycerophosphate synthase